MMGDRKQTGQSEGYVLPKKVTWPSQSDQSHPCCRTVIVGLVVASLGSGIIWLTRACCSSSKPPPPFTYKGHSDHVNAVAWSPDGKCIASGSGDGTVHVWNAIDGARSTPIVGILLIMCLMMAWSPDGQRIASGSREGIVQSERILVFG